MSPHERWAVITRHSKEQEAPALCALSDRQLHVFTEFCHDWMKWAGIPENVFFLLLHE